MATRTPTRNAHALLIVQLLGLALALLALDQARRHLLFDFNEAAMGDYTSALYGSAADGGGRVHCETLAIEPCRAAWVRAGQPPAIFWLGNSQLHGVNRMQPGDRTAIMVAHDLLRPRGEWLVGYSLPNISMMEIAAAIDTVGLDYRPRLVIIPVVLNGLRSGSVRDEVLPLLRRPGVAERLRGTRVASRLAPLIPPKVVATAQKSLADRSEDALEGGLARVSALWAARPDLRALYDYANDMIRHRLFHVTAQTRRSLINPGYRAQMALLGDLVADLRDRHVEVLLYVPPYRQDIQGPYIPAEYAQFKTELAALCRTRGAHCADFDNLVAGSEWGLVKDHLFGGIDYDFMHFTARGHDALANAMVAEIERDRR